MTVGIDPKSPASQALAVGFAEAFKRGLGIEPQRKRKPDDLLDLAEAAAYLHLSKKTVVGFAEAFKRGLGIEPQRKRKPDDLLDLAEAAAYLHLSKKTVVGFVNDRKLHAKNLGRGTKRPTYRFARADLDTFTKQQEAKPCPPLTSSSRTTRRSGTQSFGSEVIDIAARLICGASAKR
jgi:excisionase family DNA binding protein